MALINCRECGKQISDSAKQCPNCGSKTEFGRKETQSKTILLFIALGAALSLLGIYLFFPALAAVLDGIDAYNGYLRWIKNDDEAWASIIKFGFGLGFCVVAFIVSKAAIQQAKIITDKNPKEVRIPDELFEGLEEDKPFRLKSQVSTSNGWNCSCGRTNATYVSTCACGKNKNDI